MISSIEPARTISRSGAPSPSTRYWRMRGSATATRILAIEQPLDPAARRRASIADGPDKGQLAITAIKIHAVSDHEAIGTFEADEIGGKAVHAASRLVEEHAGGEARQIRLFEAVEHRCER